VDVINGDVINGSCQRCLLYMKRLLTGPKLSVKQRCSAQSLTNNPLTYFVKIPSRRPGDERAVISRNDDEGSCSHAFTASPSTVVRSTVAEVNLVRHRASAPRIDPSARGSNGRRWWAGDGAAAGRRQARVGAAAGRLQTRGHCASTPLRLAIARRPAGLKRGRWRERWRGGGTHPCARPSRLQGSSPGLRHGRREHRCGLLLLAA
jgi:hypothetical protein